MRKCLNPGFLASRLIFQLRYSALDIRRTLPASVLTNHPANTLGSPRALFRTCGSEPPPSCLRTFRYHSIMSTSKNKRIRCNVVTLLTNHVRSEEHTSELQSQSNLVCRLLL